MAAFLSEVDAVEPLPARTQTVCEFTQVLMKLQRATHLIASTLELDCLLDRIVTDIASGIGNVEVSVWLRAEDADELVLQGVQGCTVHHKGSRLRIGHEGMVGHVAATGVMRYAPDVREDPYYIACEPTTHSEVTIPLKAEGRVIGVLSVDHRELDAFPEDQLAVLQAIAGHIAIAIENARVYQSEREGRRRLEKESADARAIQQALFLKPVPLIPGFCFETAWHPAGAVAGDWFDFIDLGANRYGIALADVSGKGMSAALLMSATRALLRSVAAQHATPSETLAHLNRVLMEDFPSGKFVTMVYGVLDAEKRELTLASAGHPRPLIKNTDCAFLDLDTGLPLGLGVSTYPETTVDMQPGTQLLLYTDGITEAMNPAFEDYGPERLLRHFVTPGACVDGLIEEVQRFGAGSVHTDDATAVLIRSRIGAGC